MLQVKLSGNSYLHAAQPELSLLISQHAHPTEEKKCENRMKTSEGGSAWHSWMDPLCELRQL